MGIWHVPNGSVVPGDLQVFYSKDWLNTSLCRNCVWSGETFKSEFLCGQGNANDCWQLVTDIGFFPQHLWLVFLLSGGRCDADCQQAPDPLTILGGSVSSNPSLMSSLYCNWIPDPSRIYSPMILICIFLLHVFTWLLFLLHEFIPRLPRTSKPLEGLILFDTEKLIRGHALI